jgi:glycosyltransferase involved in cell wall biosynthesis
MKVLHVYKDCFPVVGGIENHLLLLCRGLRERGIDAEILVTNTTPRTVIQEIEGVRVTKTARQVNLASSPLSLSLPLHLAKSQPDLFHLHFPYPFGEMSYLLAGRSKPLVITYHSDVIRQKNLLKLYRPFLLKTLQRADRIIATSPVYAESSVYLRHFPEKLAQIPLGIELERFESAPADLVESIRARYPGPLLLFVGRLRYYKGLQHLLAAMPEIRAKLLVVGIGPVEADLKAQAGSLGLEGKVFFLGEVGEEVLPAHYHAADLFVLPSCERSEAFGLVQLEAMAAEKPVISTELGTGTSYVNLDGETGLVVPPADSQALARAINTLLDDEARRRRMGARGHERARQEFSSQVMVGRVAELYGEVLAARRATARA